MKGVFMNRDYFVELYDYTAWANRLVWDCAMQLSDEDFFKPLDYSIGSIFIQLLHTMGVEFWWLNYLATGELKFLTDEECASYEKDRSKFRARWDEVVANNRAYLLTLTDEELQRMVKPEHFEQPNERAISVAQALCQVANHSTDHRSQTLALLHTLGVQGVAQDFLFYLHREM
jgi:uncharacterized damage-inducible protein DinB